jgi:hypothetical protein
MNTIYVAHDREAGYPTLAVADLKYMQRALDEYCGVDLDEAKLIKFHPYLSSYASDYVGYYEYSCKRYDDWNETFTTIFHVYCIEFYTKY